MKNKGLIITIIILVIIAIATAVTYDFIAQKNYTVPNDYILQLEENKIQEDGTNIKYYVYYKKIIIETTSNKKSTNKNIIKYEIYNNIKGNNLKTVKDIKETLEDKKPSRTITKEA